MSHLAKYTKQLGDHLPQEKLHRVLQFVVQGSLVCISQIESHALSRFFAAPVAGEELRKLQAELAQEHAELALETMITALNRLPVVLPPSQGRCPQAVGREEAIDVVTELLDLKSPSVKVVVIYGQGGIGKTTLATAVFSKLDLKNYNYCRVDIMQDCSDTDLKLLQQQILKDLYKHNIQLRNLTEGRDKLSRYFKERSSKPVFVFVDNALRESDLGKLLPVTDMKSLPPQSRILLTTRNLNETRIIVQERIERCPYRVHSLSQQDAQKLLSVSALGNEQASFDPAIDIDGLLRICQGIPLVLKLAGARLCEHAQSVLACGEVLQNLKSELLQGEEDDLSERMVDFVYNRLNASCKEAFLEIVFLFSNWERDLVAISVGEIEFEELQRAALVNVTNEGNVNVHDIVQARGRMLSPDAERITDEQSLTDVLQDEERIKKTKLVSLYRSVKLEACHLSLLKTCLRVLNLDGTIDGPGIINGECKVAFENLRFLCLKNINNYTWLQNVNKYSRLAVFIFTFEEVHEFQGIILSSLKYMYIENVKFVNLTTTTSQLRSLRFLELVKCSGFDTLPEIIGNQPALEKLTLVYCSSLVSLPDSFGKLYSLNTLNLRVCQNLVSLPDSFGHLSSLNELRLWHCDNLVSLPDNFGNLSCLTRFYLDHCTRLSMLPESFGNLASLQMLTLQCCEKLSNFTQSFGQLKCLEYLNIRGCSALQSLPGDFECLTSLISIDASHCSQLGGNEIDKLAKLKGLMVVNISESRMLQERWQQVKEQQSLAVAERSAWEMHDDEYPYADVVHRAFFHSESKLVYSDENGELVESSIPAGGVKLWIVLRESLNVTHETYSSSSEDMRRCCWEAVKRKWEEARASEGGQMIYVDVGAGSWQREESATRVRQTLPHLPGGTRAWIAPDERARILFAHSVQSYYNQHVQRNAGVQNCIVSTSTRMDEEGRRELDELKFILPDLPTTVERQDISDEWLSPIRRGFKFLLES